MWLKAFAPAVYMEGTSSAHCLGGAHAWYHAGDIWYMQVADGRIYLVKLYAPWCGELLALLVIN